jgi:molybdopterin molybdotransferase
MKIGKPKVATALLQDALNRVLAEDVIAKEDLPRFDKSTVDGYAIKSVDSLGVSQFKSATFELTEIKK